MRTRRIVINTNKLTLAQAPRSLRELTNQVWQGKVALAYPMFGTTATHLLALRQAWGAWAWEAWCRALQANQPFLVEGNSVVVRMVGRGEAWIGLTDSDDIAAGQREGLPVAPMPLSPETLCLPNTVAVVRSGPNPEAAEQLFRYLQRPAVAQQLVGAHALEAATAGAPTGLLVDWNTLLRDLDAATATMRSIFLR
jgi:iron(III) transport system substrate-binding protein